MMLSIVMFSEAVRGDGRGEAVWSAGSLCEAFRYPSVQISWVSGRMMKS